MQNEHVMQDERVKQDEWKEDGFKDERLIVIPTESFAPYAGHPLIRALYPTDVGYYPKAARHHVERRGGSDQYILLYCMAGKGTVLVEGKKFTLKASHALCIPRLAGHIYYADDEDPWSILWVHFKGENAALYPIGHARLIYMNSAAADQRIMMLFTSMFRVLDRNYTQGNFIYLSQVLSLILSEIYYREKVNESPAGRRAVTKAIRYMYEHLRENIHMEEISGMLGISNSYLNIIFRRETGHAPMDFFLNLKMQEACRLLEDPTVRVRDVSGALGYDDPYYFSRLFKKQTGISPREYRSTHGSGK